VGKRILRIHAQETVARVDRLTKASELPHDRQDWKMRSHIQVSRGWLHDTRRRPVVARPRLVDDADIEIRGRIPGIGANGLSKASIARPLVPCLS
jgi:hypothetical protein